MFATNLARDTSLLPTTQTLVQQLDGSGRILILLALNAALLKHSTCMSEHMCLKLILTILIVDAKQFSIITALMGLSNNVTATESHTTTLSNPLKTTHFVETVCVFFIFPFSFGYQLFYRFYHLTETFPANLHMHSTLLCGTLF